MITNDNYHSTNQIISVIRQGLINMLSEFPVGNSTLGATWNVARNNQPTLQGLQNNTVYFDIISKRKIGFQGTKSEYDTESNTWNEVTRWHEEYLIQVSAFLQRNAQTDTVNTLTSSDIISYLQACINSNTDFGTAGNNILNKNYFQNDWVQVIQSKEIREIDFETDSGLKEKFPQFDFLMIVKQSLLKTNQEIDNIDITTQGV